MISKEQLDGYAAGQQQYAATRGFTPGRVPKGPAFTNGDESVRGQLLVALYDDAPEGQVDVQLNAPMLAQHGIQGVRNAHLNNTFDPETGATSHLSPMRAEDLAVLKAASRGTRVPPMGDVPGAWVYAVDAGVRLENGLATLDTSDSITELGASRYSLHDQQLSMNTAEEKWQTAEQERAKNQPDVPRPWVNPSQTPAPTLEPVLLTESELDQAQERINQERERLNQDQAALDHERSRTAQAKIEDKPLPWPGPERLTPSGERAVPVVNAQGDWSPTVISAKSPTQQGLPRSPEEGRTRRALREREASQAARPRVLLPRVDPRVETRGATAVPPLKKTAPEQAAVPVGDPYYPGGATDRPKGMQPPVDGSRMKKQGIPRSPEEARQRSGAKVATEGFTAGGAPDRQGPSAMNLTDAQRAETERWRNSATFETGAAQETPLPDIDIAELSEQSRRDRVSRFPELGSVPVTTGAARRFPELASAEDAQETPLPDPGDFDR